MRSEFCSSPPDPTPSNRTPSNRTLSSRTFLATCEARRRQAAPGPSCSPKPGDRAPASEKLSGFGQYIRPSLALLDDALPPPEFRSGPPSTQRAAPGFPRSSPTPLRDPASSSSTCVRPVPYARWQLSTPTWREERKPLLQIEVDFGVAEFTILPLGQALAIHCIPALQSVAARSPLGHERRHASTSATTSSPAAATSSGLAVVGRPHEK
jgi:hypothetical protein